MADSETAKVSSKSLALLSALCPLLVSVASCCLFAGMDEYALRGSFQSSPVLVLVVVGAGLLAIPINAVLLYFAARGAPVPSFIGILVCGTPLLAGSVAYAWGMHLAAQAVAYADQAEQASIMAAGLSEALVAQIISGGVTSGLLLSFGFGLAIAAQAQRARERKPLLALVGVAIALPILGMLAYAMVATGPSGLGLLVVAFVVVVGAGIAASAIGADKRSGPLAVSAVLALGLSAVAAAVSVHQQQVAHAFRVVAAVDSTDRVDALASALMASAPLDLAATFLFVPVLVLGLVTLALAVAKQKPSAGGLVSGVFLVLVLALILVAVPLSKSSAGQSLAEPVDELSEFEGFEPVRFSDGRSQRDSVRLAVSPLRLYREFDVVRASSWQDVESAFRDEMTIVADDRLQTGDGTPVPIAIDARLFGEQLHSILRIAGQAGIQNVVLIGRGRAENPESIDVISSELPSIGALLGGPTTNGIQISLIEREWEVHAHIAAAGVQLRPSSGSPETVTADRGDLGELRRRWQRETVDVSYEHELTASEVLNGFSLLCDRLEMLCFYPIAPVARPL